VVVDVVVVGVAAVFCFVFKTVGVWNS